jgi:hypothetical protein
MHDPQIAARGLRARFESAKVVEDDGRGERVTYLTLSHVAKRFPPFRNGRPVHVATITRWIVQGVRLRDGSRLHLCAVRLPGRWVVETRAVDEFLESLTLDRAGDSNPRATNPAATASASRRRAAERADQKLARRGF